MDLDMFVILLLALQTETRHSRSTRTIRIIFFNFV